MSTKIINYKNLDDNDNSSDIKFDQHISRNLKVMELEY